ncbi:hypothetical protein B0H14DRAFT_2601092 [Mycena olivaceomarginata]|nr:hypothetical protein B0H14DRAFT_2601092 [Mycena olivaceomarginata]
MRQSDLPGDMAMMNDIRVVRSVHGPPFPNPLISAQRHLVRQRTLVADLFASYASGTFRPAASSPFFVLRERQPSGPDAYVGQVSIGPDPGAARVSPINDQWEAWRSHGVLDMGAALNVAYHRRGVASAAVRVLLEDWAVPQMGATEIHASAYVSNVASVRLWEKHGFVEEKGMRGVVSVPEAKGGGGGGELFVGVEAERVTPCGVSPQNFGPIGSCIPTYALSQINSVGQIQVQLDFVPPNNRRS